MITLKIDVLKIDKEKLFKGKQGTYLDCIMIETPGNQYGDDYMIVQSATKEEREAGQRGNILGNAKIFVKKDAPSQDLGDIEPDNDDSMPF